MSPFTCSSFDQLHSKDTDLITLSRHVVNEQRKNKKATGELTLLLTSIEVASKFISSLVRRAGLANLTGLTGTTNVQGETVKKLDVLANDVFINSLTSSGTVRVLVSEENENEIIVQSTDPQSSSSSGKYCVVFDPLDGSSNIDAGVSIGSIFGIYSKVNEDPGVQDVLRPGKHMIAAGYAMYGTYTALVLSTGQGTHGYTLDPSIGEFILTHPNIQIPTKGKIYSVNEGNSLYWDEATREFFGQLKNPGGSGTPYSARYVGSMVSDVHRTLLYGGIFAYPKDKKSTSGKLRLLYECFPMAFLVENAGGKASTGKQRILDIEPKSIHQRSPIILGSISDVEAYETMYAKYES